MTTIPHNDLANALRFLAIDAVEAANSGHPGMPMGMADVATVLFSQFLKFDATEPKWPDRDRFVLSAGHGSMLLYALAYLTGYQKMTLEQLRNFRQLGSLTPGHPEHDVSLGIETTTGPLGQGIATAVGMALAERMMAARFGSELVDHHTYVIASDGDLMEGISHEAASLAGHYALSRLIVLYDDNQISIDGPTSLSFTDDTLKRFEAYNWNTDRVDGHDPAAIAAAITKAQHSSKPTLVACRTTIGYGAPTKAGTAATHGSPLGKEETAGTREKLGWPHAPFHIPGDIFAAWRHIGERGHTTRREWEQRLWGHTERDAFTARMAGDLPVHVKDAIQNVKKTAVETQAKVATRQSSGTTLAALTGVLPALVGGSADLTPSNNTKVGGMIPVVAGNFAGSYLHWGVREHGMAAAMNGMALHGGLIPYGGTFLTFTDYCRPAIRLAALMQQRVVHIMTHDSIGLGEDGPTHQPVEHVASLRAMPGVLMFRPCDTVETAECWELALEHDGPSVLALSRQALPLARILHIEENMCARGGYVLHEPKGKRDVTLLATGSEVSIALEAQKQLDQQGIAAAIVSLPSFELFEQQDEDYREKVLGTAPRIAIEAGVSFGWDRYTGPNGAFIGMAGFGASAPAEQLYRHFGITPEAVVETAKALAKKAKAA